jgi:hypothetical protein
MQIPMFSRSLYVGRMTEYFGGAMLYSSKRYAKRNGQRMPNTAIFILTHHKSVVEKIIITILSVKSLCHR